MYRRLLNDKLLKHDYYGHGIQNDYLLQKTFEIWLQNSKYGEIIDLENQLYYLSIICKRKKNYIHCFFFIKIIHM